MPGVTPKSCYFSEFRFLFSGKTSHLHDRFRHDRDIGGSLIVELRTP